MKTASAFAALLAVAVSATPEANKIEARATSSSASTSASGTASSSGPLPTITQRGNAFWNGDNRFYIRGIDYQPGGSSTLIDPLADPATCKRDIPYFQQLGLNTIRVYTVDNSVSHDECMSALADAGIYLVLDVNTPFYSLNRADPGVSYNPTYLQSIFATIDAFAGYTNTLVYFSGNEVINAPNNTNAAPYVKAVTRDMKQYIGERGYRAIPVGYSAADVSQNQYLLGQYMDCGAAPSRSDFYAINNYEWCDPSSFTISGWDQLVDQYKNYSIPLFFSEYGCITNTRTFAESDALYQSDMAGVFSGGLVYEYSNEGNGYGIVNIDGNKVTPIGQQFSDLQSELAKAPTYSGSAGAVMNNGPQECPGQSENWDTKPWTGSALPATPSGAMKYFQNGAGKGPGLKGKGSQEAPGGSTVTASANAGSVTATYGSGPTGGTGSGSGSGSSSSASSSSSSGAVPAHMGNTDLISLMCCGFAVVLSFAFGATIL